MKGKSGSILIAAGLLCLAAALGLTAYNLWDEQRAAQTVETEVAFLAETIPQVESNLFRATENVVLNKVLGYKIHGEKHSFLEDY